MTLYDFLAQLGAYGLLLIATVFTAVVMAVFAFAEPGTEITILGVRFMKRRRWFSSLRRPKAPKQLPSSWVHVLALFSRADKPSADIRVVCAWCQQNFQQARLVTEQALHEMGEVGWLSEPIYVVTLTHKGLAALQKPHYRDQLNAAMKRLNESDCPPLGILSGNTRE